MRRGCVRHTDSVLYSCILACGGRSFIMQTSKGPCDRGTGGIPHVIDGVPPSDGATLDRPDRRRAVQLALAQLAQEADALGMPLASHMIKTALEAAKDEAQR